MKVWVVEWFSAEAYSDYSGVDSVHSSLEAAEKYIESLGEQPVVCNPEDYDEGFYLKEPEMFVVREGD